VLVPGPDVFELHPGRSMQLHGVGYVLAPFPHELSPQSRLLPDLAQRGLIGQLAIFDVPARREPHPQLAVPVQEDLPLPHDEDSDREVPVGTPGSHKSQGYNRRSGRHLSSSSERKPIRNL
jgi:hypothetical protein